ncbi:MAG: 50S ribosomal protein L24 [Cyclobacteriaceae bacterium]|nr:50S ribosomal protein L24 [Cyclobacteriaceae bacterium]
MKKKQHKLHIKKGDTVKVLTGNDKGKTGKVLEVIKAKNAAIIEGVRMVTKHVKPSATKPEGGIEHTEAHVHLSNLMLIDPATGNPTRVGRKLDEKGKLQRYSKKTGEIIKNV